MGILLSFAVFAILVAALADIILIDESRIKNLGKGTWIFLVVFLPLIGSVLWLVIGREYTATAAYQPFGSPERREKPPVNTISQTQAELAKLDAEIEYFEKQEAIRRLEEQLRKRKQLP